MYQETDLGHRLTIFEPERLGISEGDHSCVARPSARFAFLIAPEYSAVNLET
jgi:hypothetical protein